MGELAEDPDVLLARADSLITSAEALLTEAEEILALLARRLDEA
jgi:hypothetical protein